MDIESTEISNGKIQNMLKQIIYKNVSKYVLKIFWDFPHSISLSLFSTSGFPYYLLIVAIFSQNLYTCCKNMFISTYFRVYFYIRFVLYQYTNEF